MENQLAYRFKTLTREQPHAGHYPLLSKAVRGMNFNKSKVTEAFNKYVHKEDYAKDERDRLLEILWESNSDILAPKIPTV